MWTKVLEQCPLIAILRGLKPAEAPDIAAALDEAGFIGVEVPLNSPEPLQSIAAMRRAFDGRLFVGGGTVLSSDEVAAVAAAGGQFIVSPNTDIAVIAETKRRGLISLPGFFTATEAFTALKAGADALKLFPAEIAGPPAVKALSAVLPPTIPVFAVGGVNPQNLAAYRAAGACGFGLGTSLYRPGARPEEVRAAAHAFVAAWKEISG